MKRLNHFRSYVLMLALACLCACAQLGIAPADTFNKKLAAGYTTVSAVADMANNAVLSGTLQKDDAKKVLATVTSAVEGLDLAAKMAASDPAGASTKLDLTIAAITALQTYLISKGVH
jgi:hypothetical protein